MKKTFQDLVNLRLFKINFTGKMGEIVEGLKDFGFEWEGNDLVLPENPLKVRGKVTFDFMKREINLYCGVEWLPHESTFVVAFHKADDIVSYIIEEIEKVVNRAT